MPGQRVWAAYAKKHSDEVDCDAYGNTWATLKGSSKRLPSSCWKPMPMKSVS